MALIGQGPLLQPPVQGGVAAVEAIQLMLGAVGSGGRMPGLRHGEQSLNAGLILGGSAGILQIRQQGRGLLWRQGKQRAIEEHILRPLLAAAQDEFGAADAFRGSCNT